MGLFCGKCRGAGESYGKRILYGLFLKSGPMFVQNRPVHCCDCSFAEDVGFFCDRYRALLWEIERSVLGIFHEKSRPAIYDLYLYIYIYIYVYVHLYI